ncbi:hypothetical protein HELRODRAFT_165767 [Helobdella robusta]|uniref:Uncharacterized protein n=1 Tax=Helobdella robusta TaxID=6412 RepID=T1EX96_HELRO|nr:hypothetical protein HELRODRAFT_165767 [Helobdella robusta]ESN91706.1 hypothetical protein HELRODRAFT_165767 [Helobdella robusta]
MTNMLDILRPLVPNSCYQSLHQEMITNKKNKSKGLLPLPSSPFQSPTSSLPSPRPSYSRTSRPASSLLPDPVHINQQDKTCKNALLPNPPSSDSLSSQDQYRRADFNKMSQTSKPLLSTPADAAVSVDLDKDRIDDELLSRKRAAMLSYEEYKKLKEEESSVLLKLEEEIKIMEMLITIQKELLAEDEQNKSLDESNVEDASISCTKTANANDTANLAVHNDFQVEMLNRTPCTANSNDNNTCDNRVVSPSSSTPSSVKTMNEHANNDKTNVLPPDKQQLDAKALEDKIIVYSRNALKSHYHKGAVTSQEFKVIMRKAITKSRKFLETPYANIYETPIVISISESKSKDITQARVSKFIDAYVEKLTAQRRKTKLGL